MTYKVSKKIIVSGRSIEVYTYDKPIWRGFKQDREMPEPKQLDAFEQQKRKELNKKKSYSRSRTAIKRIVNTNTQLKVFFTLTFAENVIDTKIANYMFNQFIKRLKYQFSDFCYLAVPERQKRGAIHYHLICNLPYIDFNVLREKIWGHGRIEVADIRSVKKIGAYISKYLTKSSSDFCKKSYFCSMNLNKPHEIIGYHVNTFTDKFLDGVNPIYQKEFYGEHIGTVHYSEYLLDAEPIPIGKRPLSVLSLASQSCQNYFK